MTARDALRSLMRATAQSTIEFMVEDDGPTACGICEACEVTIRRQKMAIAQEIAAAIEDGDYVLGDEAIMTLLWALADRALETQGRIG